MADLFKTLALPVTTPTETLVAGTVDFYNPGTTGESNRKDVYTDSAGTIVAANPYTLDANATATLYGSGIYHVVIKNSLGATIYDYDFVTPDQILFIYNPPSLTDLKALDGYSGAVVNLIYRATIGDGGGGTFYWDSADLSAQVTADTLSGIYVPPNSDTTGASGAWVRPVHGFLAPEWFGSVGDASQDNATSDQACVDMAIYLGLTNILYGKGVFRSTAPVVVDNISLVISGVKRGNYAQFTDTGGTTLYLDSVTAGDYYYKLSGTNYKPSQMVFRDIEFVGTNTANNQGGVLIAGRFSAMTFERCNFGNFTGYAIGRDPSVTSYTQNNSLRDVSFYNVGGCYGLISEPSAGALYLAETLLTLSNVNLDGAVNQTDAKPYIWDFRASREIISDNLLMEGTSASTSSAMAFATGGQSIFDGLHYEFSVTGSPYFIEFQEDLTDKFYSDTATRVEINSSVLPVFTTAIAKFEAASEAKLIFDGMLNYNLASVSKLVEFAGSGGLIEAKNIDVKTPFYIGEEFVGRVVLSFIGADTTYMKDSISNGTSLLGAWNAAMTDIASSLSNAYFYVTDDNTTYTSKLIVSDGSYLVQKYIGAAGKYPVINFIIDVPVSYVGSTCTLIVRYKHTKAGSDGRIFYSNDFLSLASTIIDPGSETEYKTAKVVFKINQATTTVFSRYVSTAPTGTSEIYLMSVKAYLGSSEDMAMDGSR